ncbi:MAG: PAS domain-containing protein [Bacteroidota bacterium]
MNSPNSKISLTEKYQFLSGGGEMGELIRLKDWTGTSVGDPADWPQSLRTTLSIILHSKFPMFLWWGRDLLCFYNDAYRPSLGKEGKHPSILGMKAEQAWPEIWPTIKPLIDTVLQGGESTWSEDQLIPIYRNGQLEDVYWTFSYSPVNDESGKPAGVFVTCTETTDKINTVKKLEESKNEFQYAIEATELGTFDYNPGTNKFKANDRLKKWFGLQPEDEVLLGRAIRSIADRDKYRVTMAIQHALSFSSGGLYDIEYTIVHPATKNEMVVRAKGRTWFDENNDAYRFTGTLQDVSEQASIRQLVEKSEKEFRQLADSLPEMVWTTDKSGTQTYASRRWKEFTGVDLYGPDSFNEIVHPEDLDNIINTWATCLQTGKNYTTEVRLKHFGGTYEWFYANGEPIRNEAGEIEKWVGTFINVNEKKIAEQNLKEAFYKVDESEKRFRNVADSAPVLIWMAGTDTLCNFFNKAWLDFTGRTMEQELGNGWAEGVHADDFQKCLTTYTNSFNGRESFYMEYRLKRNDGTYRWISDKGVPRFTNDGLFEGYIGACMDIHDTVTTQQHLKETEAKQNIVIEASELGTWELNLKTDVVTYSERYLEIFGHKKNALPNHTEFLAQLYPDDVLVRDLAFKESLQTGILFYELRIYWPDQSIHWIEVKGKVFYDDENKPLKILGTLRDITEEANYQQGLQEREQKFRLLADSMPQFVWTGDAAGNLNYFNEAVYKYSGLTPEKILQDGWLQIVHPDERDENTKRWIESVTAGKNFNFEHRFRRADGEYRWQLSRAIPQKDAFGTIRMWVGSSTDIQEIKEMDQEKDYFISLASHELKTPVTSIKGYVQMLQKMHSTSEDAFLKNSLSIVDKQIVTLTNLISDLLDLSKIKTGILSLDKEHFEINELVEETVVEIQNIHPGYNITFDKERSGIVEADKERIGQVLINFLTNAVKYSPGSHAIHVKSAIENNNIVISVRDAGIGIQKKDQEKIFERFYRVEGKNEKTFPGFGIGLFIASEIIHRHHGQIGVNSEPGKGSSFYFSLPLKSV